MTMGMGSVHLSGSILLDEPKETYPRPRSDTILRALCRRLSGSPTWLTTLFVPRHMNQDLGDLALFSSKEIHPTQSPPQATAPTVFP
jgi:hypothetical protein